MFRVVFFHERLRLRSLQPDFNSVKGNYIAASVCLSVVTQPYSIHQNLAAIHATDGRTDTDSNLRCYRLPIGGD